MPISTTFREARAAIVETIRGITPTHPHYSGALWNEVRSKDEVPSADLRNFYVELSDPEETGEIYGGCAEHEAELMIWTSYGSLSPNDQQDIRSDDKQDLWQQLHRAEIDGVSKFAKAGFEPETTDGRLWGAHVFTATLFLPLP